MPTLRKLWLAGERNSGQRPSNPCVEEVQSSLLRSQDKTIVFPPSFPIPSSYDYLRILQKLKFNYDIAVIPGPLISPL